jgi:hypothetical protein
MDNYSFQRVGSVSNTQAGNDFEAAARAFFTQQGISLVKNFSVPVGVGEAKKLHRFDLGSENPPVLVECKSHTWTQGGNMPSAKMTVWNEAMYYFHVAPAFYRKIFFVLKHIRKEAEPGVVLSQNARSPRSRGDRIMGIRPRSGQR